MPDNPLFDLVQVIDHVIKDTTQNFTWCESASVCINEIQCASRLLTSEDCRAPPILCGYPRHKRRKGQIEFTLDCMRICIQIERCRAAGQHLIIINQRVYDMLTQKSLGAYAT